MTNVYLPMEQTVYIPSTDKTQRPITESEMQKRVNAVDRFLSKKYGGFSSIKVQGGYVMTEGAEKGKLVKEKVIKVTAFATKEAFEKHKRDLFVQLEKWRSKWGQESLGYEIEGDLTYLTKSNKPIPADLDAQRAVAYAYLQLGIDYGVATIVSLAINLALPRFLNFDFTRPGTLICSGLVARSWEHGGFVCPVDPFQITPGQFDQLLGGGGTPVYYPLYKGES